MQFIEKTMKTEYAYTVEDAFGKMEFRSPERLNAEKLDQVFLAVFNIKDNASVIKGTITGTNIRYRFTKRNQWSEIDEDMAESVESTRKEFREQNEAMDRHHAIWKKFVSVLYFASWVGIALACFVIFQSISK